MNYITEIARVTGITVIVYLTGWSYYVNVCKVSTKTNTRINRN